jgi:hypothetical protein
MHYHRYVQRWHLDLAVTALKGGVGGVGMSKQIVTVLFCIHSSLLFVLLLGGVWPVLTVSVVK